MSEAFEEKEDDNKPRPKLLTVIGILSFVSLGFQFLGFIFTLIRGKLTDEEMIDQRVQMMKAYKIIGIDSDEAGDLVEMTGDILQQTNDSFWLVQFLTLLTIGSGLAGVIMMFRRRKIGFHLYIIYSLIAVGGTYLYLSPELVTLQSVMVALALSGLFVFLYSRTLRWMR